jgi:hypothetical protein
MMDQQPPRCPGFLGLPAELRNQAYEHVLGNATYSLEVDKGEERMIIRDRRCESPTQCPNVALLRVSRQIHAEASLLLYSRNAFSFRSCTHFQNFINWRTLEQVGSIAVLHFDTWLGLHFYATGEDFCTVDWSILSGLHSSSEVKFLPNIMLQQSMPNTRLRAGCTLHPCRPPADVILRSQSLWSVED